MTRTPSHPARYQDDWLTVYLGDCRQVMAEMEPESVHCVVTSPPYWGLRDYGEAGQLGLEPTPEAYVESMVAVFREVKRVLRSDGTVWLNLGDSYAASTNGGPAQSDSTTMTGGRKAYDLPARTRGGLKPKDLVGIPWRVAFALQADGWYLRSDIIWAKLNPMPESVTDRPTKSHEYLFLLSKSPRYYYDADAVREPHHHPEVSHVSTRKSAAAEAAFMGNAPTNLGRAGNHEAGRNLRSVWTIATQPYHGAHFATFPQALVEPCIKAGTSEKGVCPECWAPWERVVERTPAAPSRYAGKYRRPLDALRADGSHPNLPRGDDPLAERGTTGWRPSCTHNDYHGKPMEPLAPIPATVLDPFAGSGTTGLVAQRLSRRAVLIDLNGDYLDQVMERNRDIPLGLGA